MRPNAMHFFFYGTLMDTDVLEAVVGPRAYAFLEPAILPGWRRVGMAGATYPIVVRAYGAGVDGVLAWGMDTLVCGRLQAYEGDEYTLTRLPVAVRGKTVDASIFVPRLDRPVRPGGPWDFAEWQRRFKRRLLADLRSGRAMRLQRQPMPARDSTPRPWRL